ncbi:MAG: glutamate-cysteine ligase family protein [Bacteroidota bacterium]|nr:glutamate-cysteine ligase family protein [Bacteroidota bacterium]
MTQGNKQVPIGLFEGFGIELEYMIVNDRTLDVLPISDKLIREVSEDDSGDADRGALGWSNELVLHVVELKTNGPVSSLDDLSETFHREILDINERLKKHDGCLMSSAMHPWMDPDKEMKLWPHDNSPVYEAYHHIFDCKGHGWANLQSVHINLPFANDEEFGRLHAAVRLILPLIPALAASSPFADGQASGFMDYRLEAYRNNQSRIPSIAGKVIPEKVFTRQDYEEVILEKMYKEIAEHDPEAILQEEWLNSRGAIVRFDRNTIEIRLIDIQECPKADIAIAAFIVEIIKAHVRGEWVSYKHQQQYDEEVLQEILLNCITDGENALIRDSSFLAAFGLQTDVCTANYLLSHIYNTMKKSLMLYDQPISLILEEGTLATRLLNASGSNFSRSALKRIYGQLIDCLATNRMFGEEV